MSKENPNELKIINKNERLKYQKLLYKYKQQISDLEAKLAESEKKVKHWHDLYNERDKQFQSVRQRYHLLNKLQSNYDKKDKLHLAYMQCLELVEENEKLKQQLEETEEERDGNYENYSICWKDNEYLKQQLEEKDKEIAYMTKQAKKFNNEAQKYYEDAYCNDFQKQTKIDFAVEQLEKVKKDIDCYMAIREGDLPSNIECLLLDFADKIDNQINELNEGVKNE